MRMLLPFSGHSSELSIAKDLSNYTLSNKDIEKSLSYTQSEVEDLKERFEMETKEHSKEVNTLNR